MSDTLRMSEEFGLAASTRDRISVDLHGLKAALVARAAAERVDVSVLVRRAVERELGVASAAEPASAPAGGAAFAAPTVKLSIRFTRAGAALLDAGARRAGLSRSAYIAGLVAQVPSLVGSGASRPDCVAALNASCAELSTLSRNLHLLAFLLRRGEVQAALQYRKLLDTVGADVRAHLEIAARALVELRPARTGPSVNERRPAAASVS